MQIRTPAEVAFDAAASIEQYYKRKYSNNDAEAIIIYLCIDCADHSVTSLDEFKLFLNRVDDEYIAKLLREDISLSLIPLAHTALSNAMNAVNHYELGNITVAWNYAVEAVRLSSGFDALLTGSEVTDKAASQRANAGRKGNERTVIAYYMANKGKSQFLKNDGTPNKAKIREAIIKEGVVGLLSAKQIDRHLAKIK
jgi:hypothetical protein